MKMKYFLGIAALIAVTSAFAVPTFDPPCASEQQYIPDPENPGEFEMVTIGPSDCVAPLTDTCTYWLNGETFEKCLDGHYAGSGAK